MVCILSILFSTDLPESWTSVADSVLLIFAVCLGFLLHPRMERSFSSSPTKVADAFEASPACAKAAPRTAQELFEHHGVFGARPGAWSELASPTPAKRELGVKRSLCQDFSQHALQGQDADIVRPSLIQAPIKKQDDWSDTKRKVQDFKHRAPQGEVADSINPSRIQVPSKKHGDWPASKREVQEDASTSDGELADVEGLSEAEGSDEDEDAPWPTPMSVSLLPMATPMSSPDISTLAPSPVDSDFSVFSSSEDSSDCAARLTSGRSAIFEHYGLFGEPCSSW